jgi:D-sedoheptulose 7-phosphate isomerase
MSFSRSYLAEAISILEQIDADEVEAVARGIARVRESDGRLFILGVGGSAGHASHAVNDFRKLCGLEAYAPTDNVSELTARVNDDGWDTTFSAWLTGSHIGKADGVLIFSVGGGNREAGVSVNIVKAIDVARKVGAAIFGIVGRDGGATRADAEASILIPPLVSDRITPHTEGTCAVIWHLLVSHPVLQRGATKWESLTVKADS